MRYIAVMLGAAVIMFAVAHVLTLMSPETASTQSSLGHAAGNRDADVVSTPSATSGSAATASTSRVAFSQDSLQAARSRQDVAQQTADASERQLSSMFQHIREEQYRMERDQADIDSQVADRLKRAPEVRLVQAREVARRQLDEVAEERRQQRKVLTEVYNRMSVEGVAAVVDGLVEAGRIDSAAGVLSVLEGRAASRVLAIVAGPRPDAAALITARLQTSDLR